ncbi:hypothetical protein QBC34DRAFT_386604 [Podospora aff. communis PSN243]|uniref:Uncharacterized protein n=1 Tax=Podospora aff. communis PSN243 TaxID=3040156 RepID=A0AAV9G5H8_9PEZI|nr:hypothetical protein QBC34DRAFT_386604 [Podospora aff. communis PSN243]
MPGETANPAIKPKRAKSWKRRCSYRRLAIFNSMGLDKSYRDSPRIVPTRTHIPEYKYLTDNFDFEDTTGESTLYHGMVNPVPPPFYEAVTKSVKKEYQFSDRDLFGADKLPWAAEELTKRHEQYRKIGLVWAFAAKNMIYDLVEVAEGDFFNAEEGFTPQENLAQAQALRATRDKLPQEFFDFVKAETDDMVCPREMVGQYELGSNPVTWYGKGTWLNTLSLD